MNIAYLINNNGEKIAFYADDNNCGNHKGRLICPCCGEWVDWIDSQIIARYFRHQRSTYKKECENYCSSISTVKQLSVYEREGLDLYSQIAQ